MLKDLVELAKPKYMKVEAVWNPRGGLGTRCVVEYGKRD
ncbi:MAG: hypothetical protein ACOYEF_06975 [Planifilum sp.]